MKIITYTLYKPLDCLCTCCHRRRGCCSASVGSSWPTAADKWACLDDRLSHKGDRRLHGAPPNAHMTAEITGLRKCGRGHSKGMSVCQTRGSIAKRPRRDRYIQPGAGVHAGVDTPDTVIHRWAGPFVARQNDPQPECGGQATRAREGEWVAQGQRSGGVAGQGISKSGSGRRAVVGKVRRAVGASCDYVDMFGLTPCARINEDDDAPVNYTTAKPARLPDQGVSGWRSIDTRIGAPSRRVPLHHPLRRRHR